MKRLLLASTGVVSLILLTALFLSTRSGSLSLSIVPSDARVTIDNQEVVASDSIPLKPGRHSVEITREGFHPKTFGVEIRRGKDQQARVILALDPSSDAGRAWLGNNPEDRRAYEEAAGKDVEREGSEAVSKNPLIKILPHTEPSFRIDYGRSQKDPGDDTKTAIYITAANPQSRQAALGWIRSQGYDPSTLEIIFR